MTGSESRLRKPAQSSIPNETANDDDAHQPGSVGLGLNISRTLARLMGGDITYSRQSGRTEFQLALPLADEEARSRLASCSKAWDTSKQHRAPADEGIEMAGRVGTDGERVPG
jgi:hypothetical protein